MRTKDIDRSLGMGQEHLGHRLALKRPGLAVALEGLHSILWRPPTTSVQLAITQTLPAVTAHSPFKV